MSFDVTRHDLLFLSGTPLLGASTKATASVATLGSPIELASIGLNIVNPFDTAWAGEIARIPESDSARLIGDLKMAQSELLVLGEPIASTPVALFNVLASLNSSFQSAREAASAYLKLKLYNGSTLDSYRRYVDPRASASTFARKTRLGAVQLLQIPFQTLDAGVYGDTVNESSTTTVSGSGNIIMAPIPGNLNTNRLCTRIRKTTADNPSNVTLTGANGTYTITGSLTTLNDYWLVDHYAGTVTKYTGGSNLIGSFSGQFFSLNKGADVISISSGAGAFEVTVQYIARYQ